MQLKEVLVLFSIATLLIPFVSAISDVHHSIDGNNVTITYEGNPPFWINIRKDENIGQDEGYTWAKTNLKTFTIDLDFAINPSKKFYYAVKDTEWSDVQSFVLGGGTIDECSDGTLFGECSSNKPYYCDNSDLAYGGNGTLIKNCQKCGCPEQEECQEDGSCIIVDENSCITLKDSVFTPADGSECGDTEYDKRADFNNDKKIDTEDETIFTENDGDKEWCTEQLEKTFDPCEIIDEKNAYMSIATLKDVYEVGQKVELTDPPENENSIDSMPKNSDNNMEFNSLNNQIIDPFKVLNIENVNLPAGRYTNKETGQKLFIQDKEESQISSLTNFGSKGYIIQFKDKSVLEKKNELDEKAEQNEKFINEHPILSTITTYRFWALTPEKVPEKIKDYSKDLERDNKKIKEKILSKVEEKRAEITAKAISSSELKIKNEFTKTFNGIALNISEQEVEEIKKLSEIKQVYPNREVKAVLMDSVPLINADDVWKLQDDFGRNITGENVTIAIIDTGIDYTHSDLGGDYYSGLERELTKINTNYLDVRYADMDQNFAFNGNKIAYYSGASLFLYSSDSGLTQEADLSGDVYYIYRLGFENNLIAYYGSDEELNVKLYLYNFDTGENREIASVWDIGLIFVSGGKVVYMSSNEINIYDTADGTTETIAEQYPEFLSSPAVRGDTIVSSIAVSGGYCYEKLFVYNITSGEKRYIYPPYLGSVFDIRGTKIIYSECNSTSEDQSGFDPRWRTFHYYDIVTGEDKSLRYPEEDISEEEVSSLGGYFISGRFQKGTIGEGIVYFSKDISGDRIIAYDISLDRYVAINLFKPSAEIHAEGEEICFLSKDIYCHDYDSSYDYPVPSNSFSDKVIGGYDFVNDDNDPMDDMGHGTHCAGIAAGNGALKGVAPDARLYAYKVLNSWGSGYFDDIIAAIERAVDPNQDGDFSDHVDIISLSLGGGGDPDDPISTAVDNAVSEGVVAVIAAGNDGPSEQTIGSPGTARNAITVGAIDKYSVIASFSSRGPVVWEDGEGNEKAILKPDIVAPGVDICSAQYDSAWDEYKCLDNEHTAISGTSMATPHVAGAAALLIQKNPDWNPEEIKYSLKGTAVDLGYSLNEQGAGMVNVKDLIELDKRPLIVELNEMDYRVSGVIDITGTAKGENFERYEVYYSKDKEENWNLICSGTEEVDNGILCNLDTTQVDQGDYIVKLEVYDNEGVSWEYLSLMKFNNFYITSVDGITSDVYINGRETEINGQINNLDYDGYKIEYEDDLGVWHELCNQQSSSGDFSCFVNFDNLENGKYNLRLSVFSQGQWISSEEFEVAVIKELADNWPLKEPCFGSLYIVPGNIEGVNNLFSIASLECGSYSPNSGWSSGTKINYYDIDKNSQSIYNLYKEDNYVTNTNYMGSSLPSIKNQNIALSSLYQAIGVVDTEGNFIDDWPFYTFSDSISPFLIDEEYLYATYAYNLYPDPSRLYLYGFYQDGTILEGFPVEIEKEEGFEEWTIWRNLVLIKGDNEDYIGLMLALFNDGQTNGKLFFDIYSASDGHRVKRVLLHEKLDGKVDYRGGSFASGDLNNDGNTEIAAGYMVFDLDKYSEDIYNIEAYKSYLKVFDFEGNLISEPFETEGYTLTNIRIGDFGRSSPEIVFNLQDTFPTTYEGQRILSVDYLGNILFDINLEDYNKLVSGISIGDVTGDGFSDILIAHRPRWWGGDSSGILIYDNYGNLEKEIEISTFGRVDSLGFGSDPLLMDFDGDGNTEIILKTLHLPKNIGLWQSNIFVFETNAPYNPNKMDWPMFQHNPQHTGCYDCDKISEPRPQSKIVNNEDSDLTGYLTIKIQKKENENWVDHSTIINNLQKTVPAKGLLKLDAIFNPIGFTPIKHGDYRVVAEFKDKNGNIIPTPDGELKASWEFSVI